MKLNFFLSPKVSSKIASPTQRSLANSASNSPRLSQNLNLTPRNNEASSYFPSWLLGRSDFQDASSFEGPNSNPSKICEKVASQRNPFEKSFLKLWTEDCNFFKHLTEHSANEVRNKLMSVYYKKGEVIINEGDESDCMFIICEGIAEVCKAGETGDQVTAKNTIGELGIKNNQKRNATVKAKTDLSVLRLSLKDYDEIVRRQKYREKFETVDYLKTIPFFKDFFGSKLELIAYNLITMQYQKGQMIYEKDEPPLNFYIIKQGSVKFEKNILICLKSRFPGSDKKFIRKRLYTKVVRECGSGEYFGEDEIIVSSNRKSTALCTSDKTTIWILKKNIFLSIFSEKDLKKMTEGLKNRLSSAELKKGLKNEFLEGKRKVNAIMDAAQLSPVPKGRNFNRKQGVVNDIVTRHQRLMDQHLLSDEIFIE